MRGTQLSHLSLVSSPFWRILFNEGDYFKVWFINCKVHYLFLSEIPIKLFQIFKTLFILNLAMQLYEQLVTVILLNIFKCP